MKFLSAVIKNSNDSVEYQVTDTNGKFTEKYSANELRSVISGTKSNREKIYGVLIDYTGDVIAYHASADEMSYSENGIFLSVTGYPLQCVGSFDDIEVTEWNGHQIIVCTVETENGCHDVFFAVFDGSTGKLVCVEKLTGVSHLYRSAVIIYFNNRVVLEVVSETSTDDIASHSIFRLEMGDVLQVHLEKYIPFEPVIYDAFGDIESLGVEYEAHMDRYNEG